MKKSILFSLMFLCLLVSGLHAQMPSIDPPSPDQASPASGVVQVTVTGSNLQGTNAFQFSPSSGIVVNNIVAATDGSRVVADFNVCEAVPGNYNMTITAAGGTSGVQPFTVTQSGPVINDTAPRGGAPGTSFQIGILGCALQNTEAIFAQTTGVSFSNINVINNVPVNGTLEQEVTANMTIDASTPAGQFGLSVANPVGTSNSIFFTVIGGGGGPSLSSLSPSSEPAGTTFNLTLNGSGLSNASGVNFSPPTGISASITQDSDSQVTALVTIDPSAASGDYVAFVATPAGSSNGITFTVGSNSGPPTPAISSVSPTSAAVNTAFTLTVNGSAFTSLSTIQFNGKTLQTTFANNKLTANVSSRVNGTTGNISVTVSNPGSGNSGPAISNTVYVNVH